MNKAILIGNLTRDPELSTTNSGASVCKFGLAVNRRFTNKQTGEREVDFFNITVWSAQGENCHKYLRKGNKACVTGRIETRSYEQDGVKKYAFDIIADDVEFLTSPNAGDGGGGFIDAPQQQAAPAPKVKNIMMTFMKNINMINAIVMGKTFVKCFAESCIPL